MVANFGADAATTLAGRHPCVEIPRRGAAPPLSRSTSGPGAVVVESDPRARRDTLRTAEMVASEEVKLQPARAPRPRRPGRIPARIRAAAQRVLAPSGAVRLFDTEIAEGRFVYHHNEDAHAYEQLLAGSSVPATSLTPIQADTAKSSSTVTGSQQSGNIACRVLGDSWCMAHDPLPRTAPESDPDGPPRRQWTRLRAEYARDPYQWEDLRWQTLHQTNV